MESSYRINNLGYTIYGLVRNSGYKNIVEFGTLEGYSAYHILKAIQDPDMVYLGSTLKCYDLWDGYEYNHGDFESVKNLFNQIDMFDQVTIERGNFYDWIENPEPVDLLHLDISNDGDIIEAAYNAVPTGTHILFEGGSKERDSIEWMVKYNKKPINSIRDKIPYTVIDERFPSISLVEK